MRWIASLLVLIVAAFWFFGRFAGIDLAVSALFFDGDWFGRGDILFGIRNVYYYGAYALLILLLVMWLRARLGRTEIPSRDYGFLLAFAVSGAILVNWVLKEFWGRARPQHIVEFGGDKVFTPAQIGWVDQCAHNCSFVSGEAAGAVSCMLILGVLMAAHGWGRIVVVLAFLPMALLRISAGAHFLSDVVFSALFMGLLFVGMRRGFHSVPFEIAKGAFWRDISGIWRRSGNQGGV